MKTFNNITIGELSDARFEMRHHMRGIPANTVVDLVNWEAVAEYIFENWRDDYDNDDIDFVHDELCISPDGNELYILEVQELEDGTEFLYIEVIMNGR